MIRNKATLSCGILIAADYNAPNSGNFIASLLDLAEAVKDQNGQVVFLFPEQKIECQWVKWIEEHELPVYFINREKTNNDTIAVLKGLIELYNIKVVHLHFGYMESLLLTLHKSLGVKLVIHDHFDFVTDRGQIRQRFSTMKKAILYRINRVYCISVMEKKNKWYWPAGKKRHYFISNGLSLRRAEIDELSTEERRKEIGLHDGEKLALFLGWDMYRKGIDIAIKAVELYRKKDSMLKIGVIGVGHNGSPQEKAIAFLKDRDIDPFSDAIIYMHGYEDIFALNRAADCYISSSRAEAFSYGILEAISQNTPVVVSDIVGTSWCWSYEKCFRYPVENPEACAKALGEAIASGRAPSNYDMFVKKYSNESWVKRILTVYKRMINE